MSGVPLSTWDQMGVVVLYTLLFAGTGMALIKLFAGTLERMEGSHKETIEELNRHYMEIMAKFEARWSEQAETFNASNALIVGKLENLGRTIDQVNRSVRRLNRQFEEHDAQERQQLEGIEAVMEADQIRPGNRAVE